MDWNPYRLKRGAGGAAPPKLAVVLELENDEVPCGYCQGTGKQIHMNSSCPVCRGKGFNKVKSPAVICAYCKGSGFSESSSHTTCPACGGKTAVTVKEPFEVCEACRGTGKAHPMRVPCFTCKGVGVARVKPPSAVKGPSKYPVNPPGRPMAPPPELFPEPKEEEGIEKTAPVKVMKDFWGSGSREDR